MSGPSASRPTDLGQRQPPPPAISGENMPDPWGVRRAENLLTSLEGVLSARVVTTPLGEVSEVHVLAQAGIPAKQLVRNVESALLAQLGLRVDHRKISIAQTAEVKPIETLERHAVREKSLMRSVLFEAIQVTPGRRPGRSQVQVVLTCLGKQEGAEEEGPDTLRGRVEAAARATVAVLDRWLSKGSLALEGAKVMEVNDRTLVFTTIQAVNGRDAVLLTGTAEVKMNVERAAVLAVLDATNRWTEVRRPA
ncbi:MAG TPA: hypothetical protein VJK71_05260 [Gemmatimonadales bacterium]|nr:hypothetical protein [Gemmatimonadales bacterium]